MDFYYREATLNIDYTDKDIFIKKELHDAILNMGYKVYSANMQCNSLTTRLNPSGIWGSITYFQEDISVHIYYKGDGRHDVQIDEGETMLKKCKVLRLRSVLKRLNKYCGF